MDLIYARLIGSGWREIGVIPFFDIDLAFGKDENNYELRLPLEQQCLQIGDAIGIYDTEYGGVVDAIEVDTKNNEVIYSGRTYHGILASAVIDPGDTSLTVSGSAVQIMRELYWRRRDFASNFFYFPSEYPLEPDFDIDIPSYTFDKPIDMYTGFQKMLQSVGAKLKLVANKSQNFIHARIEPMLSVDHTDIDNVDSTQADFRIKKGLDFITHLICLGGFDEHNRRYRIELGTDYDGNILPYATVDEPYEDSQYINQEGSPAQERSITEVLDMPEADTVETYVKLDTEPTDWEQAQIDAYNGKDAKYFRTVYNAETLETDYEEMVAEEVEEHRELLTEPEYWEWMISMGEVYEQSPIPAPMPEYEWKVVEPVPEYGILANEPDDWEEHYDLYYTKVDGEYERVQPEGSVTTPPQLLARKPKDWEKNFASYFVSDGQGGYENVRGIDTEKHVSLTSRPEYWDEDFGNYYYKTTIWKKKKVKGKWQYYKDKDGWLNANKYYDQKSSEHELKTLTDAPRWQPKKYYAKETATKAPRWDSLTNVYYISKINLIPVFTPNVYYQLTGRQIAPAFQQHKYYTLDKYIRAKSFDGNCYEKKYDHYKTIVQEGIERIKESVAKASSCSLEVELEENYDVMDTVELHEQYTGLTVRAYVSKKIVQLTETSEKVSYEIETEV